MSPEEILKGIRAIKSKAQARKPDIKLILESFRLARQTEAWEALICVFMDLRVQYVERAAFSESEAERLLNQGAAQSMDAIVDSMTSQLSSAFEEEDSEEPEEPEEAEVERLGHSRYS